MARRQIKIFDTTLRDGEQSPGVSLTLEEKLEIARQLARLRVDVIEAGFPVSSRGEFEAVSAIAREIEGPVICALARAERKDIERAWEAVKSARRPRIHTFIAASEIHMKYKLRRSPEEVLRLAAEAVRMAKSCTEDVEFSAEDATRSDPDFLCRMFALAVEAGATTINVPDTVGYATPGEFHALVSTVREKVPGIEKVTLSVHCHNDLGLAVANSLAAVEAGAGQVECTVNGLGERAGNTALEELVMALLTRRDHYGRGVGIITEQIYRTSRLVSTLSGVPVQPNKAIVGANAFCHQSGIHQDGVLKNRATYEIMTPQSIGLAASRLVFGKVSGRHAFRDRLRELGYEPAEDVVDRLFTRFKEMADRKKNISDRDIEAIVETEMHALGGRFRLEYYHVLSGNHTVPTATVRVATDSGEVEEAASGKGPVDAVFRAIDRATRTSCRLADYSLRAVTSGKDALGEVTLRVERGGRLFVGRGVSVDVIEASAKAYINALNRVGNGGEDDDRTPGHDAERENSRGARG